ncbi:MAG: 3-oxoacyl-ACP reductase FabG [Lentisphaeria bacterium]|jgi:3-oxoacyl-[acyl-carrier protein] reductase
MTHFDFAGQTVIVTGGTRGIGRAIVLAFLHAGAAKVMATYAGNEAAAEALKLAAGEAAARLELTCFDVADYAAVEAFYKRLLDRGEKLHVLVNNAGIRRDSVLGMMSPGDWQSVIATNLNGTYNMSKFAVMLMSGERYGRIIAITSPSGKFGFAGQANYAAAKAGQAALTRSLSKEVAKRGITVNCVSPGFIETDLIADLPPEQAAEYRRGVPLQRFGRPEEVAYAVLFLASREAAYITGETLEVTGGL